MLLAIFGGKIEVNFLSGTAFALGACFEASATTKGRKSFQRGTLVGPPPEKTLKYHTFSLKYVGFYV